MLFVVLLVVHVGVGTVGAILTEHWFGSVAAIIALLGLMALHLVGFRAWRRRTLPARPGDQPPVTPIAQPQSDRTRTHEDHRKRHP